MGQSAFLDFKLEWRTFLLGSSIVNVLPPSDFGFGKKVGFFQKVES